MSSTRVYIGHLARDARARDLERLFKNYGEIREVNVKSGFGFVEFKSARDAKDVVYDFHGKNFLGERLIVEIARGARRTRDDGPDRGRRDDRRGNSRRSTSRYRLVVENVAPSTNWQDLKDMMRKAGEVIYADVGKPRPGEGVVDFADRADMEYALKKMNDRELNGQRITLRLYHRERSRHSRSRSRSRSRSPRRSSRRSRTRSPSVSRSRSVSPRSRSRSASPRRVSRSQSPSRSRSRSPRRAASGERPSRRSASPSESQGYHSPEPTSDGRD
ncbi:uncharacterized protein BX664DRAFT_83374 [Halteromyces radiatus]|uniref:uncharacterized protein n=1 Tax=Halteromyces radiatus TaxID=101107 RepID=UPI002220E42F|nr:uncharacterized protein BX664DRAFT_83374 [Halteromyces radiatus]KAI8097619.1 hypothetical protein BX664DRAFT_83374 [Halteromyces radiatus]